MIGHTDEAGDGIYNRKLGLRRTIGVYSKLKELAEKMSVWKTIKDKINPPQCHVCIRKEKPKPHKPTVVDPPISDPIWDDIPVRHETRRRRRRILWGDDIPTRLPTGDDDHEHHVVSHKPTLQLNNLNIVTHTNKKTGKPIHKICNEGYKIDDEALKACKFTKGEDYPVLANNYDGGRKNEGGRSANRRVEVHRVDAECIIKHCDKDVMVSHGTTSWKMNDFSEHVLRDKCESVGCVFTSRKVGTERLYKLLEQYDGKKCPKVPTNNAVDVHDILQDDDIPIRHSTFLEVMRVNRDSKQLRSGNGIYAKKTRLRQKQQRLTRTPGSQGNTCKANILGTCKLTSECPSRNNRFVIRKGYCNGNYYCCSPQYTTSAICERKISEEELEEIDEHEIADLEDRIEHEDGDDDDIPSRHASHEDNDDIPARASTHDDGHDDIPSKPVISKEERKRLKKARAKAKNKKECEDDAKGVWYNDKDCLHPDDQKLKTVPHYMQPKKYKQKVAAREAAEREADKIGKRRRGGRKQGGGRRSSGIPHYMQPKKYKQKIAERESNDGIPVRHSTRL